MELKINEVTLPAPITFNYEELKSELLHKVSVYETMVYTEDQVKEAKADRAALNRLKKALNDERIRQEKEYMQPFNTFKAQIAELVKIIDNSVSVVDKQVKEFDEKKKAEKLDAILEYFGIALAAKLPSVPLNHRLVVDDKWLNASVSMKSIQEAIDAKLDQVAKDLAVIASLPSYAFEARECYVDTLDLARAVSEAHRLQEQAEKKAAWEAEQQKRKEEADAIKPSQVMTNINDLDDIENLPSRKWIGFQALLSADEAKALGAWLRSNGIRYKAI
jgi:hypothetical protein